jgi:large subunit ribosomal protein L35
MPKMKTKKAAAKRFKQTGTGKFKRRRAYSRHLLEGRSQTAKKRASKAAIVHPSDVGRVERMLPYGL